MRGLKPKITVAKSTGKNYIRLGHDLRYPRILTSLEKRRLYGAAGEVLAEATRDQVTDEMVTKSFLQSEIQKIDQKLETELEKLSMRLTIRMGTIAAICVGALAAIIKL